MKKFLILIIAISSGIFFYSCTKEDNARVSNSKEQSAVSENLVNEKTAPLKSESRKTPALDASIYEPIDISESDSFSYPIEKISDGKAKYFSYDGDDGEVRFFLLKSSDGVARAAFDACDVCFKWKLGYYQSGDLMVCRRCGQTFPSVKINEIKGGCNPAPLKRTVSGKNLVIAKKDIEEGLFYFR